MRKIFLLQGLLLLISDKVFSQPTVPVDPLTGRAQIAIPIWNLTSNSIQSSVAIVYDGGGIRVGEGEGNAGMGWKISAGGSVEREVRGLPDDYNQPGDARKGWLHGPAQQVAAFSPADEGCTGWNNFAAFTSYTVDTEPDIFRFSAPGLNGLFVFDNNATLRLIPFQDLKVTPQYNTSNRITSVEIINNLGVKYLFSATESNTRQALQYQTSPVSHFSRDYNYYNQSVTYNTRWHLTSITGTNGEAINFHYYDGVPAQSKSYVRKINSGLNSVDSLYFFHDKFEYKALNRITTSGYDIEFIWTNQDQLISEVRIRETTSNKIRRFAFNYQAIRNPTEPTGFNGGYSRNYLSTVVEENNCEAFPAYRFEYYNPASLPYKNKYPLDFFGYYNAASVTPGTAFIPSLYVNNSAAVGERFRIYARSGYTTVSASTARDVNASTIHYGSIHRIYYPSGGFAEVSYQPNDFYDDGTATTQLGGGVRVSSVRIDDGDTDHSNDIVTNYEYKAASGQSSGRWVYNPSFGFSDGTGNIISPDNLAPEQSILYERATISQTGQGKTVFEYLVPARYPQTATSDWVATKTRIVKQANPTCPSSGNLRVDYYAYPFAPNMNFEFERGLLSKGQTFHENGQLIIEKAYTYQRLSPATIMIKAIGFEKANGLSAFVYGAYSLMAQVDKTIQTETITNKDLNNVSLSGISSTSYVFNSNQMLSEINTTNSDGKVFKTQFKYAKDFAITTPSGMQAAILKKFNSSKYNRHGTLVETVNLANTSVIAAALTMFDSLGITGKYFPASQHSYYGSGTFQHATVTGTPQVFTADSRYIKESTIEEFNPIGNPVSLLGRSRIYQSVVYAKDNSTPVLKVAGARSNQVVFSDFENSEAYQLANFNVTTDSWTGERSYQQTSAVTLSKNNLSKSTTSRYYRFYCRAKATTASNITLSVKLSNGAGGWITTTAIYPTAASGTWRAIEARIDMNLVPATFNLQLTTSATITLDDILFYPESAEVEYFSYRPLHGKLSATNTRGQSIFYEYDNLGRLTYLRNGDKQIIEAHEYRYQIQPVPTPRSAFTSSSSSIISGQTVTFTAPTNCISPITYSWSVNGVIQGSTSSTMVYTFLLNREYDVQLTVSHPQYGSTSTIVHYDIPPAPLVIGLTVDNTAPIDGCWNDDRFRTFTATISHGCYDPGNVTYEWYYSSPHTGDRLVGTTTTPAFTFNVLTQPPFSSYVMTCIVRSTCGTGQYLDVSTGSAQLGITFNPCN